jgi:hypothetical protein
VAKALEALEASVKAGFTDDRHIEADPDLAPLRQEARYHEILENLRKAAAAEKAPRGGRSKKGEKPPAPDE